MTTVTCTDTIRAALYARVSTADQSINRQHDANLAACERFGWTPVEYDEPGLSASRFGKRDRRQWGRLLADLSAGKINVIVLWEPSRGDRQLTGWSALLDTCRKYGVLVHITSQNHTYDLSRPREWRNLAEDGIDSAYESEKLSMRIKDGKDYWRNQGHPVGGKPPYGIRRVNDPDRPRNRWLRDEPDPKTGHIAARIVREVAAGRGWAQICAGLDADGIPTAKGNPWNPGTIVNIARKPIYAELGMVTEKESLTARARINDAKRKGERPTIQRFWYSSVIACGVCGQMLRGTRRVDKNRYLCPRGHVSIPASDVDSYLDERCIEKLSRPALLHLSSEGDVSGAAEARAQADRLQAELDEWVTAGISARAYALKEAELQPKIDAARKRARELELPSALAGLPDENWAVAGERWLSLTIAARKAAFRALYPDATAVPTPRGRPATIDQRIILRRTHLATGG